MKIKSLSVGLAFALMGSSVFAATVQTDLSGVMTGINGISLSSGLYDVAFNSNPAPSVATYSDSFALEANQGLFDLFQSGALASHDVNASDPFGFQFFHTFGQSSYDPVGQVSTQTVFTVFNDLTATDGDFAFQDFSLTSSFLWAEQISLSPFEFSTVWSEGVEVSAVPIPGTALLFAPAMLGFMGLRRKTKDIAA